MKKFFSLAALGVLASFGAAQTTGSFVVPSSLEKGRGNSYFYYLTWYSSSTSFQPAHVQMIYDVKDIKIPAAMLKEMYFRRSSYVGNENYTSTAAMDITLAMGPNSSAGASTTFKSNLGSNPVGVFKGTVNFPNTKYVPPPNLPPWNVKVVFSKPFPYISAQGKSLVVDVTCRTFTVTGTKKGSWYMDMLIPPSGKRASNPGAQYQCKFSNGKFNSSLSYRSPVIGGVWYVRYNNLLPNAAGFGALGNVGVKGKWGPITLPFDLTPLGAPGCSWNINVLTTVALKANSSGSASWPSITIPNTPVMAGAVFYDHAAFLDAKANSLGIVTTWSSKWTVGGGSTPPGSFVYKYRDTTPPSPTGYLRAGAAVGIKFGY